MRLRSYVCPVLALAFCARASSASGRESPLTALIAASLRRKGDVILDAAQLDYSLIRSGFFHNRTV